MLSERSRAESIASWPPEERRRFFTSLSPEEAEALRWDWQGFWARPSQLEPPGAWLTWLILTGRGWGKSRTGAETVRHWIETGTASRIGLIGRTPADVRDVMIEGPAGLLTIAPPTMRPVYEPTKRRLTWPNGAVATAFSAEVPDQLRGPQFDAMWWDELAQFRYSETWDNGQMALRLGLHPRQVVTTTPKPVRVIRELLDAAVMSASVIVTRGTTYDNRANLAPGFYADIVTRYEGTRLARQEIHGEYLEDFPGALWTRAMIEGQRVTQYPRLARVVLAIDPALTHGAEADETGIAVVGRGENGHYYVLHGSGYRLSPLGWARRAVDLAKQYGVARIIGERNNGGEMVEQTIRTVWPDAPLKTIHASQGKAARAEPVAALYERGLVHHAGVHAGLEDQMVAFPVASENDDRVDALVYAIAELMEAGGLKIY